jgi:uncharacterized protein (TIGR00730 family)
MTIERPRIGVLGSARIEPPDPRHAAAVDVGRRLGDAGFDLVTGGYGGLMGAVSEGASGTGVRVIGLPMRAWTELGSNRWVTDTIVADDFFDRLRELSHCSALVALDGGVGTLAEVAVTWANLQTDAAVTPPLLLVGSMWEQLIPLLRRVLVVDDGDMAMLRLVSDRTDLVAEIRLAVDERPEVGRRRG